MIYSNGKTVWKKKLILQNYVLYSFKDILSRKRLSLLVFFTKNVLTHVSGLVRRSTNVKLFSRL